MLALNFQHSFYEMHLKRTSFRILRHGRYCRYLIGTHVMNQIIQHELAIAILKVELGRSHLAKEIR